MTKSEKLKELYGAWVEMKEMVEGEICEKCGEAIQSAPGIGCFCNCQNDPEEIKATMEKFQCPTCKGTGLRKND